MLAPRPSLKDLFVSSPPFEVERGGGNFKDRSGGRGGEGEAEAEAEAEGHEALALVVSKRIGGGGSIGWGSGPGSPRPGWTGFRYRSLLRRAWRPILVTIPED